MTHLEFYKKLIEKAKRNGYTGPDYLDQIGWVLQGTNYYAIIFRHDFAKAIWGNELTLSVGNYPKPKWIKKLGDLVSIQDKWEYLKNNVNLED